MRAILATLTPWQRRFLDACLRNEAVVLTYSRRNGHMYTLRAARELVRNGYTPVKPGSAIRGYAPTIEWWDEV